jgi:hypothetical protein
MRYARYTHYQTTSSGWLAGLPSLRRRDEFGPIARPARSLSVEGWRSRPASREPLPLRATNPLDFLLSELAGRIPAHEGRGARRREAAPAPTKQFGPGFRQGRTEALVPRCYGKSAQRRLARLDRPQPLLGPPAPTGRNPSAIRLSSRNARVIWSSSTTNTERCSSTPQRGPGATGFSPRARQPGGRGHPSGTVIPSSWLPARRLRGSLTV